MLRLRSGQESQRCDGTMFITLRESVDVTKESLELLNHIIPPIDVVLKREVAHRMLELSRQELFERSIRGLLTGLFNRQHMRQAVNRQNAVGERNDSNTLSLLMLNLDHFKAVIDTYGHPAGDEVLRRVSALIRGATGVSDLAMRLDGRGSQYSLLAVWTPPGSVSISAR
ncbi:MAG: PleD family two-component response regulator [Kiritimatiellia bacterium]